MPSSSSRNQVHKATVGTTAQAVDQTIHCIYVIRTWDFHTDYRFWAQHYSLGLSAYAVKLPALHQLSSHSQQQVGIHTADIG